MAVQRGFTLVELLAVVAIIVIMASLLIPGISGAMERAHDVGCKSNLRQWATAVMIYSQENGGRLPSAQTTSTGTFTPRSQAWYDYGVLKLGYSTNTLICKSTGPTNLRLLNNNPVAISATGQWPIPTGAVGQYKNGYTCNSFWIDRDDEWQPDYRGYRITMVPSASRALMFGDGDGSAYNGGDPTMNFRYRHGPGSIYINVAMFDGRVDAWSIYDCRTNGLRYLGGAPVGCPGACTNWPLYKVDKRFMPPYS